MNKTIKNIKVYRKIYFQKSEETETGEFLYEIYEYDKKGNLLLLKKFLDDGSLDEQQLYEYNDKGDLISEEISIASIDSTHKRTLEYCEAPHAVIEKVIYDDGNFTKKVTSYDEDRITKIELFEDGNTLSELETYEYNENKLVAAHSVFDENNSLITKETYEYNERNDVISEKHYEDETLVQTVYYKYNDSGRLARTEISINGIPQQAKTFDYDEHGNNTKETTLAGNNAIHVITSRYDRNNNCIEMEDNNLRYGSCMLINKNFNNENLLTEETCRGASIAGEDYSNRMEYEFY